MNVAIVVWILAQAVAGQSSRQIAADKQWTIEGDVTTDAGPATGADIFISGPPWRASTDAEGHYVLKGTASGTFILSASKDGVAPSEPKDVWSMPTENRSEGLTFPHP